MAYMKVITGPMFSGKTEELLRVLRRSELAEKRVIVFKPSIDVRTDNEIVSRGQHDMSRREFKKTGSYPAFPIRSAQEALSIIYEHQPTVIGIDEAQFFDVWLPEFLAELLEKFSGSDLLIVAAGLDMDAWRRPFGIMPQLFAMADEVQKETAVCFVCKARPALFTQKLVDSKEQVQVGDAEIYEARCRVCHELPKTRLL